MCTVIYYPAEKKKIFVSLRDESPLRAKAKPPALMGDKTNPILAPIDPKGHGTWAGINGNGNVIILLNGGFEKHLPGNTYARSRGLIVTELLGETLPVLSWLMMNLNSIEPFTLIVYSEGHLFQLIWDGHSKHKKILNPAIPYIFSSATLYDLPSKKVRQERFFHWIEEAQPAVATDFKDFFTQFQDPVNGFLINRDNKIKTLSFSFIEYETYSGASYSYYDLNESGYHKSNIRFNTDTHEISSMQVC